ncbi:unnamed protein product [Medioppia subpectinata]|uniref:Uncharacterized protein n=1 Tax=Medioppia subpectinata TaxID=1979941 RepID=A0A7R9KCN3_9ACAR|nr:unnamed protein product [Medioppia subpectinata]CAG2100771.1 unnamed protein product [Medioppia subpectinata]
MVDDGDGEDTKIKSKKGDGTELIEHLDEKLFKHGAKIGFECKIPRVAMFRSRKNQPLVEFESTSIIANAKISIKGKADFNFLCFRDQSSDRGDPLSELEAELGLDFTVADTDLAATGLWPPLTTGNTTDDEGEDEGDDEEEEPLPTSLDDDKKGEAKDGVKTTEQDETDETTADSTDEETTTTAKSKKSKQEVKITVEKQTVGLEFHITCTVLVNGVAQGVTTGGTDGKPTAETEPEVDKKLKSKNKGKSRPKRSAGDKKVQLLCDIDNAKGQELAMKSVMAKAIAAKKAAIIASKVTTTPTTDSEKEPDE